VNIDFYSKHLFLFRISNIHCVADECVLFVHSVNVVDIRDTTFADIEGGGGGVVLDCGSLVLINCSFVNCSTQGGLLLLFFFLYKLYLKDMAVVLDLIIFLLIQW
jgi:hypothetical protein